MVLYQVSRPLSYLQIRHSAKRHFDWTIPLFLLVCSVIPISFFYKGVDFFSPNGLLCDLGGFFQILPGFYIAALAAIATFNKLDIDQPMPSPPPTVIIMIRGQVNTISLTRRRFLCMLFSFLTAESFFLAIFPVFLKHFSGPVKSMLLSWFPDTIVFFVGSFVVILYLFMFWQMVVATLLGLYYLGDRLHQPDDTF